MSGGSRSERRTGRPPEDREFELTLLGPGYGESIVMHIGSGEWAVVDSFLGPDRRPAAIGYLEDIGVNPIEAVVLIVATHWHDDHIGGIAHLVEQCPAATFCCASALCREEFLALADALKIPHHGSENAHLPAVWDRMLEQEPFAVLSPWRRGGRVLPTVKDAKRILRATPNAWITSRSPVGQTKLKRKDRAVERTLRGSSVSMRRLASETDMVRLRHLTATDNQWTVETFGNAGPLRNYAA